MPRRQSEALKDIDTPDDDYLLEDHTQEKPLSLLNVSCIAAIYVTSSPSGYEDVIASGGSIWSFVCMLLMPWLYALPLALITCEQVTRFPYCGGAVHWAFSLGVVGGHLNAILRFLTNVCDNPLYPIYATDFLSPVIPELLHDNVLRAVVYLLICIVVVSVLLSGVHAAAIASLFLFIFALGPFVLFFFLATPNMTPAAVFAPSPPDFEIQLGLMIALVYWTCSGLDGIAAFGYEVKRGRKVLLRAYLIVLVIGRVICLGTGAAGMSITRDPSAWFELDFGAASLSLPYCESGWLSRWMRVSGFVGAVGTFIAAIAVTSRELFAGALYNAIPFSKFIGRVERTLGGRKEPISATIVMVVLALAMAFMGPDLLDVWSGIFTVVQGGVQCAAFVAMRLPNRVEVMKTARLNYAIVGWYGDDEEGLENVFTVPGGWLGVAAVIVPLLIVSGFMIYGSGWTAIWTGFLLVVAMVGLKGLEMGVLWIWDRRSPHRIEGEEKSEDRPP
jgi:hypothetical protein